MRGGEKITRKLFKVVVWKIVGKHVESGYTMTSYDDHSKLVAINNHKRVVPGNLLCGYKILSIESEIVVVRIGE